MVLLGSLFQRGTEAAGEMVGGFCTHLQAIACASKEGQKLEVNLSILSPEKFIV
jgi:hypothetical protein